MAAAKKSAFIRIGDVVLKKSSIVFIEPSDMLSADRRSQVKVKIAGQKEFKYIPINEPVGKNGLPASALELLEA